MELENIKARVLLADDDDHIIRVAQKVLEKYGYEVYCAYNGESAWELFKEREVDICVLDISMPGLDGFELGRRIRMANKLVPIIFWTSRCMEQDKINGFIAGADDYVTKFVNWSEIHLRMQVFLRRTKMLAGKEICHIGAYRLNMKDAMLIRDGECVYLSPKEAAVLQLLAENMKQVVSRKSIIEDVWRRDKTNHFADRSLEVFISRIRKYLKGDPRVEIESIRNVGYRLQVFDGID
jgi:DNA-binding response OmpR family regulator